MRLICQASARVLLAFVTLSLLLPSIALAQLPVATGRQIAMSNPEWKLFIPDEYRHRPDQEVDLLVHFHGDPQTVWNNVKYAKLNTVVVTANYNGLSSAYRVPFEDPTLFRTLLNDARTKLRAQEDFKGANWDRFGVSSFSAGYGAVREILKNPLHVQIIDGLLAADSLYATTASDGTPLDSQMVDYKAYADLAANGDKHFVFTHTEVQTFTYESTEETGDELLQHLGLATEPTNETGLGDISFFRKASAGDFQLWGSSGATADDHLSHLRYMGQWLDELSLATLPIDGDFNADGRVDAADYTVWRDGLGSDYTQSDYEVWRANYGQTSDGSANQSTATTAAIPEPSALLLMVIAWALVGRMGSFV